MLPETNPLSHPSVTVSELEFSDGTRVTFSADDVVVVVGPNNAGKSATLRSIRDKLTECSARSPVIRNLTLSKRGTSADFTKWIQTWTKRLENSPGNTSFSAFGYELSLGGAANYWNRNDNTLGALARWMCHFLSADERLSICNPPGSISLIHQAPSHPIHFLQRDDSLELSLSAKFRKAFAADLIVHRNAGALVPLHVGERPGLLPGEDRVSLSYIERLEALPQLQIQGDGMRSFAGVLLAMSVGRETIMLIDEPEAFLHPPQAKLLGSFLVNGRRAMQQLFIATHSADILRGVLDANSPNVKVLRLRRQGETNHVRLLDNKRIGELWSDPLLRYSNILDGLFHDAAVICEGDADCRFYSAVLDSTHSLTEQARRPDALFTHCGGKARMPLVIRALREVDVPVRAVADFDILADEYPLRAIVEALGHSWTEVETDWGIVKSAVDAKRPDLSTGEVKREFERILNAITTVTLPERARLDLQGLLRRSTAWSNAKLVGKSFVPSGDAARACEQLLTKLRSFGLHVVEVGELEGFCRTVSGHGPKWANGVLTRDLRNDPELQSAREFASRLL